MGEPLMFEYLHSMDPWLAREGIYFAKRVLKHRRRIRHDPKELWYRNIETDPSAEQVDLGVQLISQIEAAEGKPVKEFDEARAWDYIGELADISGRIANRDVEPDPEGGERLLEELRRTPL
jgi:hypothetical protein